MIPVKLKISNFTSYGENVPELDFTKFHMAAISGQNGAGKSSLLDSITWCVWGVSRLGDNSDSLVRLGQKEMLVEFSFELDGHIYTVKRARLLKGGGQTVLELLSNSHNLTEGTIKATQQKIINTLHLTFETFVNSAFIRQGHADEFTTKGPTDRKRILADILGLANYDALEEKAKEKAKEIQTKMNLLEYQLLEIEAELSQKEEREKKLTLAEEEASKKEVELKDVEKEIKSIELEREVVQTKLKSLQDQEARIEAAQKELVDLKMQISLKENAREEYQGILDQREAIEKNYAELLKLQEVNKGLEIKRTELIKVKDELNLLRKDLQGLEQRRSQAIAKKQVEIKECETEKQQAQAEIDHLKSHKDQCPTCGQMIGEAKNKEIITKNQTKISEIEQKVTALNAELKKIEDYVIPQQKEADLKEEEVKKLEEETKEWAELNSKIYQLDKYLDLQSKLAQAEAGVKAHEEAILDLKKIYQAQEEQITKQASDLKDLATYQQQLLEIRSRITAQEEIREALNRQVLELRGQVGEAKQLVSRAKQMEDLLDKRKAEKKVLQEDKEAFEELSLAFGKKGIQAMIIETAIPEIEDEANALLDRLTEGRMRIALITQKETKGKVTGTGEKGIVETLDIIISDEMGERPYEAYSGGEQFRVNFAIRLALSKLLTHRAGAKLQFLVIDEGFGTQDAEGRSRIVEALDAIKDDFEKILVITHLEELREEFPVRIEVSKGATGSTFEVVGV